jgi:hypothetical protein
MIDRQRLTSASHQSRAKAIKVFTYDMRSPPQMKAEQLESHLGREGDLLQASGDASGKTIEPSAERRRSHRRVWIR